MTRERVAKVVAVALLLSIGGFAIGSWAAGGIVATLLDGDRSAAEKLVELQEYFDRLGWIAPFAYVAFITVEVVVAPIPGLMLNAPGGVIFGGFWGGLLSLIGNGLGASLAFFMSRALGREYMARYLDHGKRGELEHKLSEAGLWVVFLLRVNPLTSSDLVSYAAGVTSMKAWKLVVGTLLGMAPLCWLQSYLAEELFTAFPGLIYLMVVVCVIYVVIVIWILKRIFSESSEPA